METLTRFTRARWSELVQRMGLALDGAAEFDRIEAAHAERHRAYHTAVHIDDCLGRLDEARALCDEPDEIEFALWLHDAVYRTRRGGSEEESARWATDLLERGGADEARRGRVHALILVTCHDAVPPPGDASVMVDIDLSILGAPTERFDAYEDEVRREYRWVPGPLFRSKRVEILRSFLDRDRIYATDRFHDALEARARENVARSIARLGGSTGTGS
ncbi:MAG: N-methyl-D-aspartate receptor NMDAR2C subunit [Planctomycetota bacterium]